MKINYKCNNCNNIFVKAILIRGIFVCPQCKKPEFEKINYTKYENTCCFG